MPNRLIDETSPYLLQHAHNPVDWYPWGDEAFDAARRLDRPILLSVGYSACHWCHVMEHESFSDALVAARMNTFFVNVKVDREERPDVDDLYMRAVQAFNEGRGGWPMTVFLTPDGKPFFGGTYFPPTARGGTPGFVDVLDHVRRLWQRQRDDVDRLTEEVVALLDRSGAMPAPGAVLARQWLDPAVKAAAQDFDLVDAGFGDAPKFPPHGTLAVLLAHHVRTGEPASLKMATATLEAMAKGGLYDLLAGGFARYSVDGEWRVPHFEKMLYDNAQLLPLYADAYRLTGQPWHARIARETAGWMVRELRLEHGGLAAAQDADSEGREGAYFAWTPEQLAAALGDDAPRVAELLQVTDEGTFEHGASVLRLDQPIEQLGPGDRELLARALPKLLAAREQREKPARDDKVVTAWNAAAASGLARAGVALGEPSWVQAAVDIARLLLDRATVDGRLMRTFKDGRAHVPAYADDHAWLVTALLDLWEATGDVAWLDAANRVADRLVGLFWDEEGGGLFQTGRDQPALVARTKPYLNGAEPSANGVAALAFVRLAQLGGRGDLGERAEHICRSAQQLLSSAPRALGAEALAGAWLATGGLEIAVVGEPDDPRTRALLDVVNARVLPMAVRFTGPVPDPVRLPWTEGKEALNGVPTAYVCEGYRCRLPVTDPADLASQLDDLVRKLPPAKAPAGARVRAPALPSDPARWLGTDLPLTLDTLRGQIVVLDFWTYCCVNCLHALPELAAIEERFADDPVVVIGVHSAKFGAEKVRARVLDAMARHGVRHPVVLDGEHDVWEQYAVRSWPTLVVLDATGRIALQQSGEPDRDELASVLSGLLEEAREAATAAEPLPLPRAAPPVGGALAFPGKVHVWPDAWDQELGADAFTNGLLYVADTGHHRILECLLMPGPDGWPRADLVRTFGNGEPGFLDGPADAARFRHPQGIRRFRDTLYVADTENHALRAIDLDTGDVSTLAGTGRRGRGAPSREALADARSVDLRSPWDVEVMPFKTHHLVYVAMAGSHQIWVYANGHVGILAGSGREDHIDGPSSQAALAQPSGLAMYGRYLLFADSEVSSIRAVDMPSNQVVTVVGRGLFDFGDVDGSSERVRLQHPLALTFTGEDLFVADTFNHKIKRIGLSDGQTRTIAGGSPTALNEPGGVARAGDFLIVADTNNHRVRTLRAATGELRDLEIAGLA